MVDAAMMALLICLIAGVGTFGTRFGNVELTIVVTEGDSNTNNGFQNDSTWPAQLWWSFDGQSGIYGVINVAKAGDTIYNMRNQAAAAIDIYDSPNKVCFLMGGGNDMGTTTPDSIATLIEQFCTERRAAGWRMYVMTLFSHHGSAAIVNDSIKANWSSYADGIILIDEAPNIGIASDNLNPVYWWDVDHLTVLGAGIVADSVRKYLD
jgi:hypothetical protein